MGARSDVEVVDAPFPVVFDALVASLPAAGFRITSTDRDRGHIRCETRNTELVVAVGAVDAVTTEWVATAELKLGMFRDRHAKKFAAIRDALSTYLSTYYA